jgi:hypothetical protein
MVPQSQPSCSDYSSEDYRERLLVEEDLAGKPIAAVALHIVPRGAAVDAWCVRALQTRVRRLRAARRRKIPCVLLFVDSGDLSVLLMVVSQALQLAGTWNLHLYR